MAPVEPLLAAATVLFRPEADVTLAMLRSLAAKPRRLYVFINGPIDEVVEAGLRALPSVAVIRSAVNVGLGFGLNAVMEQAAEDGARYVLLLDQDATVEPDLPERLLARAESADEAADGASNAPLAAFAPLLVPPADGTYREIPYPWRDESGEVDFLPTCGTVVSTEAWRKIGPFRADYFIGVIDVEWGFRARHAGYRLRVLKGLRIEHRWGPQVTGPEARRPQILRQSDERNYYHIRNTIDCLKLRHVPPSWKLLQSLRLGGQIALLTLVGLAERRKQPIFLAIRDGLTSRLGPRR